MKSIITLLLFVLTSFSLPLYGQGKFKKHVKLLLEIENAMFSDQFESDQTIELNYVLKTVDWDGSQVISDIHLYKNKNNLHFFSSRVDIFKNEEYTISAFKQQKVILLENNQQSSMVKNADDFYVMRKNFISSCVVKEVAELGNHTFLVKLRSKEDNLDNTNISSMEYTYNDSTKTISNVLVGYDKSYDTKEIQFTYNTVNLNSTYQFNQILRSNIIGEDGNLKREYLGYGIMDKRKR